MAASGISTSRCPSPSSSDRAVFIYIRPRHGNPQRSALLGSRSTSRLWDKLRESGRTRRSSSRSLGTSNILDRTQRGGSRPGQPEIRQRGQDRSGGHAPARPLLIPIGTPSNVMAASMSSVKKIVQWEQENPVLQRPRNRSTISASGGQGGGVVWVDHGYKRGVAHGGGARRWRTILTITNLRYQRAKPSPLWSWAVLGNPHWTWVGTDSPSPLR